MCQPTSNIINIENYPMQYSNIGYLLVMTMWRKRNEKRRKTIRSEAKAKKKEESEMKARRRKKCEVKERRENEMKNDEK